MSIAKTLKKMRIELTDEVSPVSFLSGDLIKTNFLRMNKYSQVQTLRPFRAVFRTARRKKEVLLCSWCLFNIFSLTCTFPSQIVSIYKLPYSLLFAVYTWLIVPDAPMHQAKYPAYHKTWRAMVIHNQDVESKTRSPSLIYGVLTQGKYIRLCFWQRHSQAIFSGFWFFPILLTSSPCYCFKLQLGLN